MKLYISAPHSNWFHTAMKIYLAGSTGNINAIWREGNPEKVMKLFLAGTGSRPYVYDQFYQNDDSLKDFVKKLNEVDIDYEIEESDKLYILESYYYRADWMEPYIQKYWHFLLDSGAFTFMENASKQVDFHEYLDGYVEYINRLDVDLFFELDIDSVVGIKKVEELRKVLEDQTGKRCIPVWHKSRGLKYWHKMVEEYDYVAIGGIANKTIKRKEYPVFTELLKIAAKNKCKVHGLGFTSIEGLYKYKFHSVDSTSWLYGNRGGYLYKFDGRYIRQVKRPTDEHQLKNQEAAIFNFHEWVKFQKYADKHL